VASKNVIQGEFKREVLELTRRRVAATEAAPPAGSSASGSPVFTGLAAGCSTDEIADLASESGYFIDPFSGNHGTGTDWVTDK
jgi:hypothetical protein